MYSALFDASVLHPWALCNLELLLAEAGFYRPVWTAHILEEAKSSILRKHPALDEARVEKRMAAMRLAFEDANVSTAIVEAQIAAVPASVPEHDRHVVAAALAGRADVLVTSNQRHFPSDDLGALGLLVQSPDDFLIDQWYLNAPAVAEVLVRMALDTKRPPLSPEALLTLLARTVPSFVATVRDSVEWIEASAGLEQLPEPDEPHEIRGA
ncbi:MAG: PIN domain-containing protein [Candidatus Limnocylindrales bacterium]